MSNFFDSQGGFKGSPPVNHRTPAAGEWSENPVRHRTIGETLAMEKGDYSLCDWLDNNHSYKNRSYRDNSYNDWSSNDHSYNDKSYNSWSYNRPTSHAGCNQSVKGFEEIREALHQFMEDSNRKVEELKVVLASMFRSSDEYFERLFSQLSEVQSLGDLNTEQLKFLRDAEAHEQEKVMELVQPNQLEGTNDSTLETDNFEDTEPSCIEPSSSLIPFDMYYELFCEHDEPSFQVIESMNDEDKVGKFKEIPHIDFIFPPNAFHPFEHSEIKLYFLMHPNCMVKSIENFMTTVLWAIVHLVAHIIQMNDRRRTKGSLAQPFDTFD